MEERTMVGFKVGDRVRYNKRHSYNGNEEMNGREGTVMGPSFTAGHILIDWDGDKWAPNSPFIENIEPIAAPIPIPTDIAERAMALVTDIAERRCVASEAAQISARAILDALKPVDGDLVAARKVCEKLIPSDGAFAGGEWDEGDIMKCTIAAIAKGRLLERGGE